MANKPCSSLHDSLNASERSLCRDFPDLPAIIQGLLPNFKKLSREYSGRVHWLDREDALLTLIEGALLSMSLIDPTRTVGEQSRYIAQRAHFHLCTSVELGAEIRCPDWLKRKRNQVRRALAEGSMVPSDDSRTLGALFLTRVQDADEFELERSCPVYGCETDDWETKLRLRVILEHLPSDDAAAFTLVRLEGFSGAEAAAKLGMTYDRLCSRLKAAIKAIQRAW